MTMPETKEMPRRKVERLLIQWVLAEASLNELARAYSKLFEHGPVVVLDHDDQPSNEYTRGRLTREAPTDDE